MDQHYGARLKMLHCCTDQTITGALAEMELTAAQGHVMGYIAHQKQPPCPRDLEEVFGLSHPTVSGILNRLTKKEFIALRPDENDRRCKRIYILPKGEACIHHIEKTIDTIEQRLVQDFTPQEKELFIRLLDRAVTNMGGPLRPILKEE